MQEGGWTVGGDTGENGSMKKYQIIYADPPWPRQKGGLRSIRPRQGRNLDYPTLTLSAIKGILGMLDSDIMFLWTIDKYLHEAEEIAHELDYKLHARIVWDKGNGVAPAFTVRYTHEYLLWLYKGKFTPIDKSVWGRYKTVLREDSTSHSTKPHIARKMIESMYPDLSKIELFARQKVEGWDAIGNDIDGLDIRISLAKIIAGVPL